MSHLSHPPGGTPGDTPTTQNGYGAEVSALDVALDIHISELRRRQDAGDVGPREAAALRVELLEAHLRAVKALQGEHFPEDYPDDDSAMDDE